MPLNIHSRKIGQIVAFFALVLITAGLASGPAMAQNVPSTAEGGRFDQPFVSQPLQPRSSDLPVATPDDGVGDIEEIDITFRLNGVVFEGSTGFTATAFEPLYADQIGQDVTVDYVFELAQRATAFYRNEGYILSQVIVPPQEIDGGMIRLQAVEGFVDEVVITGSVGSERGLIDEMLQNITEQRPLHNDTLERYLLLAGDLAGLTVQAVFSPSETNVGAATLTVQSIHRRVEAAFELTNYGSDFVGPLRGEAEFYFNSLLGLHERLGLKLAVADDGDELLFGELSASVPISSEGTSLFGRVSVSDSEPGENLRAFDVANDSLRWSVGLTQPLIRSRDRNLFLTFQFDWDDLTSDTNVGRVTDDHLRTLSVSLDYDFVDTAFGPSLPAVTAIRLEARQGLGGLGATSSSDPNRSRLNADGTFTSLRAEFQRYQSLGAPGWTLLTAVSGQISNGPLLSSEEFGFGGSAFGRGFDPSAILGDRGIAGKLELQYQAEWQDMADFLDSYQLFAFVDAGLVQNVDVAGVNGSVTDELWSAGGGLRLDFAHGFESELAVAWVSDDIDNDFAFGNDHWRWLFRLAKSF